MVFRFRSGQLAAGICGMAKPSRSITKGRIATPDEQAGPTDIEEMFKGQIGLGNGQYIPREQMVAKLGEELTERMEKEVPSNFLRGRLYRAFCRRLFDLGACHLSSNASRSFLAAARIVLFYCICGSAL